LNNEEDDALTLAIKESINKWLKLNTLVQNN
jgi:hypothetical protein